jgi:hypothetical protein
MTSPFVKYLLRDLDQSFKDSDYCDVLIEVGENDKKEILKAHSFILIFRSPYFKAELSSNLARKENDKFIFTKPENSPEAFRKILK